MITFKFQLPVTFVSSLILYTFPNTMYLFSVLRHYTVRMAPTQMYSVVLWMSYWTFTWPGLTCHCLWWERVGQVNRTQWQGREIQGQALSPWSLIHSSQDSMEVSFIF